jgi:DnaJ-class molecular chaperone
LSLPDYYSLLEVDPKASEEVIRKAYRALAAKSHPDSSLAARDDRDGERMRDLNAAYATLSDPAARAEYDRRRARDLAALFYEEGIAGLVRRWMRREGLR